MQLFTERGIDKTSMRNIASKAGYTAGNVYLYFRNKAEILHSLHSKGFQQLRKYFEVLQHVTHPLERVKAMGRTYLQFAEENPEMYDLMFSNVEPIKHLDEDNEEHWQEGNKTFQFLKDTLQECMDIGLFKGHDLEATSFLVWSIVHGMASLHNAKRLNRVKFVEPDKMVALGYAEFCMMIDRLQ